MSQYDHPIPTSFLLDEENRKLILTWSDEHEIQEVPVGGRRLFDAVASQCRRSGRRSGFERFRLALYFDLLDHVGRLHFDAMGYCLAD